MKVINIIDKIDCIQIREKDLEDQLKIYSKIADASPKIEKVCKEIEESLSACSRELHRLYSLEVSDEVN